MFFIKTKEEKQFELERKRAEAHETILDCLSSNQSLKDITLLEMEALLAIILKKATRLQFQYGIGGHITATEDIPTGCIAWSRGIDYIDIHLGNKFTIHNVSPTESFKGKGSELIMRPDKRAQFSITNYWSNGSHTCSIIATF